MTCIYCRGLGPFTAEHVIPAGLGGDDKEWMLKDCVCGTCNTEIFSPLETKFLRSSPVAIARLFLQSRTRKRGAKTGAPSLQAPVSYYDDVAKGLLLEQELVAGGSPTPLPQIVLVPPAGLSISGPDAAELQALLDAVDGLVDEITLVEKVREDLEVRFHETRLVWEADRYVGGGRQGLSRPSQPGGIWLEPLVRPVTQSASLVTPRLFRRRSGALVCRATDSEAAAEFLSMLRAHRAQFEIPADATPETMPAAEVHIRQHFDPAAFDRVLTKIAINLCAHLFGAEAVRQAAFDNAREYAYSGSGRIKKWTIEAAQQNAGSFGPELEHHHVFRVNASPAKGELPAMVAVAMRLYGGLIENILVAEGGYPLPSLVEPVFVVVDYENHQIERMNLEDYCAFAVDHAREGP